MPSHTDARTGFKVGLPLRVIRIGLALDFRMPPHRHTTGTEETYVLPLPLWAYDVSNEHPVVPVLRPKVFLLDPPTRCVRVPPLCPLLQQGEDVMVHRREGPFAGAMLLRLRPTPNHWIELHNQLPSCGLLLTLHEVANRLQKGVHVFFGWRT